MPTIISYNDGIPLSLPTLAIEFPTDLGTVGGRRYLSVPDGFDIPETPPEADLIIHTEALPPEVRLSLRKLVEINRECVNRIRERYTVDDELAALRTGDTTVTDYIAACVAEGKAQKAALGL